MRRPVRHPEFRLEVLDDELLLHHPAQTAILYCNQTASLVWQLCDGQHTTAEIINLLQAAFPAEAEAIPAQVKAVLSQFAAHGAIHFDEA